MNARNHPFLLPFLGILAIIVSFTLEGGGISGGPVGTLAGGGSGGTTDHSALSNLAYATSGHTGFAQLNGSTTVDFSARQITISSLSATVGTFTSGVSAGQGSAANPALRVNVAANLAGFYSSGAGALNVAVGGVDILNWTSAGQNQKVDIFGNSTTQVGYGVFRSSLATLGTPSFAFSGDLKTGLARKAVGEPSLVASNTEVIGMVSTATWMYNAVMYVGSGTSASFNSLGDATAGHFVLRNSTTVATTTLALFIDGSSLKMTPMLSTGTRFFDVTVVMIGTGTATAGGEQAAKRMKGVMMNSQASGTSFVGEIISESFYSPGASLWDASCTVTAVGQLNVTASVPANVRCVGSVNTTYVGW